MLYNRSVSAAKKTITIKIDYWHACSLSDVLNATLDDLKGNLEGDEDDEDNEDVARIKAVEAVKESIDKAIEGKS